MRELTDRTIVVCGGGAGIGAASAIRLASEGARIIVGDVNATGAKETAATINSAGGTAIGPPTPPRKRRSTPSPGTSPRNGVRTGSAAIPSPRGTVLTEAQITSVPPEERAEKLARTRSARLGQPADIASTVAFLFSADADWINGQVWTIDGGALLRQ
jgi:NAD(P)-dependent dehydrogenase (short-subunit alcohol dehydrogenase family)